MKKYLTKVRGLIAANIVAFFAESCLTSAILYLPGYFIDHYQDNQMLIIRLIVIYLESLLAQSA